MGLLTEHFKKGNYKDLVAVAADIGATKRARDVATRLDIPLAIMEKRRLGNNDKTETLNVIGEVKDRTALIVDDEIDTAGSLIGVTNTLFERGARDVFACCTHPIFSGPAVDRISGSRLNKVIVTNTVPPKNGKLGDKVAYLSIAPLLGEAIRRIHTGQSVGAMFEK